jgi:hypothetical protein
LERACDGERQRERERDNGTRVAGGFSSAEIKRGVRLVMRARADAENTPRISGFNPPLPPTLRRSAFNSGH